MRENISNIFLHGSNYHVRLICSLADSSANRVVCVVCVAKELTDESWMHAKFAFRVRCHARDVSLCLLSVLCSETFCVFIFFLSLFLVLCVEFVCVFFFSSLFFVFILRVLCFVVMACSLLFL